MHFFSKGVGKIWYCSHPFLKADSSILQSQFSNLKSDDLTYNSGSLFLMTQTDD